MADKVTICGSMQFSKEMIKLKKELEVLGWTVFTPDFSEKSNAYLTLPQSQKSALKKEFIVNHFERIKQSDAILVANYDKKGISGYIGSNTLMEIAAASVLKEEIYVLNSLGSQGCEEEVKALTTRFLNGNLQNI